MIIDVVDDSNQVRGQADRNRVLRDELNFRTVHALLRDRDGQLVLQRLPADHPRSAGLLGSSVAGYLLHGESYRDAVQRKLVEELGVLSDLRDLGQFVMHDQNSKKFVGVFQGTLDRTPRFDREQIAELVYLAPLDIYRALEQSPEAFTETFREVFRYASQATG